MCEYCEDSKQLKSYNFGGQASLAVYKSDTMAVLEVLGDKKKFSLFKRIYCPRFDINYCPMCGRKLE